MKYFGIRLATAAILVAAVACSDGDKTPGSSSGDENEPAPICRTQLEATVCLAPQDDRGGGFQLEAKGFAPNSELTQSTSSDPDAEPLVLTVDERGMFPPATGAIAGVVVPSGQDVRVEFKGTNEAGDPVELTFDLSR